MDNYENENPEIMEETENAGQETSGSYHAEGVGQKESITQTQAYAFRDYQGEGVYQQPAQPEVRAAAPAQKPARKERKWFKRLIAAVLILALVIGSCAVTAAIMDASWQEYTRGNNAYWQEKLDILQQQLENKIDYGAGSDVTAPAEGMTPAQVYTENVKSVVAISCKTMTSNGFGQSFASISSGSGFIMTQDGYVVTNHHVIDGASTITVVAYDEQEYTAKLIGSDASNDIALLKIEAQGLRPVKIGSSEQLSVGSQVVAIGNALGELTASLTVGYISGKDRDVSTDGTVINMLQTDAAINSGNSGGPLFNMAGEVVGITTAKYSGATSSGATIEGICFAIPMDDVIGMLEDLKNYGYITGVQLGVMVKDLDASTVEVLGFSGVYVDSVIAGGCAAQAGVKGRDIILSIGGYEIENMSDLSRALRKFKAGEEATIKVWRGGREVILNVIFDAKPQS